MLDVRLHSAENFNKTYQYVPNVIGKLMQSATAVDMEQLNSWLFVRSV
jgi:hypothetical protein